MVKTCMYLLPVLVGSAYGTSVDPEKAYRRLHHHSSGLSKYVGAFLDMLNPVPQVSNEPERLLSEEQKSFLELASDPRKTYLVWQGAMKVAKEAGTHAEYLDPEVLLPRALHQVESARLAEQSGDFKNARMLRQDAAVDMSLALKTMGDLLGVKNQERFWKSCIANGKAMWKTRDDAVSKRSLALLETVESLFHGAGTQLLDTHGRKDQIKRKLEKITAVHSKLNELKSLTPNTEEFQQTLGNVSQLLREAEAA